MKEEIKIWIDKAKDDLRKAKGNLNIKNYDLASYLCQQSAEKALKSLLIKKTKKFPKIHDLVRLGKLVKIDKSLLEGCKKLTPVYIESRYPNFNSEEYTKEDSEEDIKIAERILKWVVKKL